MKVNVHVKKVQQVPRPVKALYVDAAMKAISKNWKYFGPHFEGNFRFFTNPQLRSPKDQVKEIVIRADPYYLVPSWNSSTADKSQREKWLKAYKAIISSQRLRTKVFEASFVKLVGRLEKMQTVTGGTLYKTVLKPWEAKLQKELRAQEQKLRKYFSQKVPEMVGLSHA